MSHKHLAQAIALLAPAILTGCVDSSYDLNDIKDVRVEVKDLTLPANLEPITMDNVIKFDEICYNQFENVLRSLPVRPFRH